MIRKPETVGMRVLNELATSNLKLVDILKYHLQPESDFQKTINSYLHDPQIDLPTDFYENLLNSCDEDPETYFVFLMVGFCWAFQLDDLDQAKSILELSKNIQLSQAYQKTQEIMFLFNEIALLDRIGDFQKQSKISSILIGQIDSQSSFYLPSLFLFLYLRIP